MSYGARVQMTTGLAATERMRTIACAFVMLAVLLAGPLARPAHAETMLGARLSGGLDGALARFPGAAAIVVRDRATGYRYAQSDDRVFYAASLYKLGVMVEAYRQAAAGLISLDGTAVTIEDEDTGPDGWYTPVGVTLTVREAIERMITLSDNSPSHALLRLLDPHNVNATTDALGLRQTRINTVLPEAEQTLPYNTTSARDMEQLLAGLLSGTVVDAASSAEMLEVLKRQRVNDRLPAGLPDGTVIAHKTGNLDGVAHDVGIIYTPAGPRIVVLLTGDYDSYDDVLTLAETTGAAVYGADVQRLGARIVARDRLPTSVGATKPLNLTLTVTNTSSFTWDARVRLGAHWRGGDGRYVRWDTTRVALPPLAPGASAAVDTQERVPNAEGPFTLEWEMVEEGVAWSGDRVTVPLKLVATAAGLSEPTFLADETAQESAEIAHGARDAGRPAGPPTPVGPRPGVATVPSSGGLPAGSPSSAASGGAPKSSAVGAPRSSVGGVRPAGTTVSTTVKRSTPPPSTVSPAPRTGAAPSPAGHTVVRPLVPATRPATSRAPSTPPARVGAPSHRAVPGSNHVARPSTPSRREREGPQAVPVRR